MIRWIVLVAGLVGAVGVALGAYAAHGLEESLVERGLSPEVVAKKLNTCDIAVRYHLLHAAALLALAAAPSNWAPKRRSLSAIFFLFGLGMFCGILYAQSMGTLVGLNLVVPFGGLSFILGWLCLATCAAAPAAQQQN
ncbi:MAG: DUF423 domain-containing protein [Pirellulaceae bacterium]|nr:DUF423 domain-containing protein [Pirellulaceae bacterium]